MLNAFDSLLEPGDALVHSIKAGINGIEARINALLESNEARVKIHLQIIDALVHRLLVQPTRTKDAYDERSKRDDDCDDKRIHVAAITELSWRKLRKFEGGYRLNLPQALGSKLSKNSRLFSNPESERHYLMTVMFVTGCNSHLVPRGSACSSSGS